MTDNAPVMVERLDQRKQALTPGDQAAEMAFWEAAAQLGLWFVVNHGTRDEPAPKVFQPEGATLIAVYSSHDRAAAAAGEGNVDAVPMPAALDWLASYAEKGATGIVMDHPGPWIPLANLSYLKRWVPEGGHAVVGTPSTITLAPEVQTAMDTYLTAQDDETYDQVLREVAGAELFVVMDPAGDGSLAHMVNNRGDRSVVAFTDSARVDRIYAGKEIDLRKAEGAAILAVVCDGYDAVLIDPMHPSMYVATPDRIMSVLSD